MRRAGALLVSERRQDGLTVGSDLRPIADLSRNEAEHPVSDETCAAEPRDGGCVEGTLKSLRGYEFGTGRTWTLCSMMRACLWSDRRLCPRFVELVHVLRPPLLEPLEEGSGCGFEFWGERVGFFGHAACDQALISRAQDDALRHLEEDVVDAVVGVFAVDGERDRAPFLV